VEESAIYEKWNSLGFLESLCEKHKIMLANAYEYTANKLLDDAKIEDELDERKFNDELDVLIFPVLRNILTINNTLELTEDFVDGVLDKLFKFVTSDIYKNFKELRCCMSHRDVEMEMIHFFVEMNYGQ